MQELLFNHPLLWQVHAILLAISTNPGIMPLTPTEIRHIAKLARLALDDHQVRSRALQLSRILELIEQMNRIDTRDIEPMSHPQNAVLRFREDEVTAADRREDWLEIAPASHNGLYLVPRVIE